MADETNRCTIEVFESLLDALQTKTALDLVIDCGDQDIFSTEILPLLDDSSVVMFSMCSKNCYNLVKRSGCLNGQVTCARSYVLRSLTMLKYFVKYFGYRITMADVRAMALKGDLQGIRWLRHQGMSFDETVISEAARGGNMGLVKWLHSIGCKWDRDVVKSATEQGHLNIIKFIEESEGPITEHAPIEAAMNGQFHIFQYFAMQLPELIDNRSVYSALRNGHIGIARWALTVPSLKSNLEGTCPWKMLNKASESGKISALMYVIGTYFKNNLTLDMAKHIVARSGTWGHTHIFQWLYKMIINPIGKLVLTFDAASLSRELYEDKFIKIMLRKCCALSTFEWFLANCENDDMESKLINMCDARLLTHRMMHPSDLPHDPISYQIIHGNADLYKNLCDYAHFFCVKLNKPDFSRYMAKSLIVSGCINQLKYLHDLFYHYEDHTWYDVWLSWLHGLYRGCFEKSLNLANKWSQSSHDDESLTIQFMEFFYGTIGIVPDLCALRNSLRNGCLFIANYVLKSKFAWANCVFHMDVIPCPLHQNDGVNHGTSLFLTLLEDAKEFVKCEAGANWLLDKGYPLHELNDVTVSFTVKQFNIPALKWLRQKGCRLPGDVIEVLLNTYQKIDWDTDFSARKWGTFLKMLRFLVSDGGKVTSECFMMTEVIHVTGNTSGAGEVWNILCTNSSSLRIELFIMAVKRRSKSVLLKFFRNDKWDNLPNWFFRNMESIFKELSTAETFEQDVRFLFATIGSDIFDVSQIWECFHTGPELKFWLRRFLRDNVRRANFAPVDWFMEFSTKTYRCYRSRRIEEMTKYWLFWLVNNWKDPKIWGSKMLHVKSFERDTWEKIQNWHANHFGKVPLGKKRKRFSI